MKVEKIRLGESALFVGVVLLFIFSGQSVGWRAVGVLQLAFSLNIIRKRSVGFGWEGFEPSFYITGAPAVLVGLLSACIAIILLFYPEQTVMKWSSK